MKKIVLHRGQGSSVEIACAHLGCKLKAKFADRVAVEFQRFAGVQRQMRRARRCFSAAPMVNFGQHRRPKQKNKAPLQGALN
jgi:hypothetical protein